MKNRLITLIAILLYSSVLTAQDAGIIAGNHDSTMTYYDFIPDTILPYGEYPESNSSIDIDLNHDNIYDYRIESHSLQGMGGGIGNVKITPLNANEVNYYRTDSLNYGGDLLYFNVTKPFEYGETINDSSLYTTSEAFLYYYYYFEEWEGFYIADWCNQGDKYLGIRININDTIVYGWIRLKIKSGWFGSEVTIMEYALTDYFEPSSIDITEGDQEIRFYPNPVNNNLIIHIPDINQRANILIIDAVGKTCLYQRNVSTKLTTINTGALKKGLYILRVETGGKIYTRKLIKK